MMDPPFLLRAPFFLLNDLSVSSALVNLFDVGPGENSGRKGREVGRERNRTGD